MKKIYLSGPMTGFPEFNYPLFNKTAKALRGKGFLVYNPAEYHYVEEDFPLKRAFSEYCGFIINEANAVYVLPGWERSKGASAEVALARVFGLEIVEI